MSFRPRLEILESRVVPAWVMLAAMPTPRSELAAAFGADGRLYAIGGEDANGSPLGTVEAYNPATNVWTTVASLSTPRFGFAAVEAGDGRIYVIGGMASTGLTNIVEAYTPSTNLWTQVATFPTPRSELAAALGSDGRIYAIGGQNASGTALGTVEAYSPTNNTWATIVSLNTARSGLAVTSAADGRILAFGGKGASALTNVVEAFSAGSRRWTTAATLPTVRTLLAGTAAGDGKVYAIGGEDATGNPLSTVEAYTPPTANAWASITPLNTARSGLAAAEGPDGRIFAVGGKNTTQTLATLESLTVVSKASSVATITSSLNPSVSGQSVTFTATVSAAAAGGPAPTGTAQFQIDGRNAGPPVSLVTAGGVTTASFTTTMLMAGTRAITASYSGDSTFASSSASLAGGQTVSKASTNTAIASSINPSVSGQSVVFTATISVAAPGSGTPTGTVQFQIDGSNAGSPVSVVNANGLTTASFNAGGLAVGTHTVAASYSGDTNFSSSNGTLAGGQVVNPVGTTPTTTTVASSASTSVFGQAVTFTATISVTSPASGTPTGTVQFQIDGGDAGNPVVVSTSGGVTTAAFSTATLAAGTHTITATYSGDSTFAGSNATITQTVDTAATSTLVVSSANPILTGQSITFTATISVTAPGAGTPTGTVQFQIDGSDVGSPVTVSTTKGVTSAVFSTSTLGAGSHTVTAIYSGDNSFAGSTGTLSGGQVVNIPIPPSNAAFVAQVYLDLFHRVADPSGTSTFNNALDQGASRTLVVHDMTASLEWRIDVVENLYSTLLHRAVDIPGLIVAVQFLMDGGTDEQLAATIAGSDEYFQSRGGGTNDGFLMALYQDVLGRAIDTSGQMTFSQALIAGMTRVQVAAAIYTSPEYRQNLVEGYYMTYLRRAADSGGLNTFVSALQSGATDENVIAAIVGSDEYFQRL